MLRIRRIAVTYRIGVPEHRRAEVERVNGFHAKFCPVARSIMGSIEVDTKVEFAA